MKAKFYFLLFVLVMMCELAFTQDDRIAYLKDPELIEKNNFKSTENKSVTLKIPNQNSIVKYEPVVTSFGSPTFVPLGQTSIYDIQSDRTQIWQDPLAPVNVHITFMYSNDTIFADRRCGYYFSNDRGASWEFIGNVSESRLGFPTITGLTTGSAVIAAHAQDSGGCVRTLIFVDLGPGFGAFARLDPGCGLSTAYLWPAIVRSNTGQIVFAASGYTNRTNSLTPPGTFSGYSPYIGHPTGYDLAVSPTGKIGHAYIGEPSIDLGDVFFRESTDNGLSWSSPKKIWDFGMTKSFLGCLKGISIVYGNNDLPYVVFETIKMETSGGFYPGLPSKIRIWSPTINNGTSKIIADENNVPFFPNQGIVSDGFAPVCRPVIGIYGTGGYLYVAFNATTANVSPFDSSAFYSIYFTYSFNGSTWSVPEKLTPGSPLKDWRYVSISKRNQSVGPSFEVHLFSQEDEIAGSHVHGAPLSHANYTAIRFSSTVNINGQLNSIPEIFSLNQNYPNPFNPETVIEYDLSRSSDITLKIIDVSGKEIATLVNEKQNAGIYSVKWDARSYPSGIYFYELSAENYSKTKRMIVLK